MNGALFFGIAVIFSIICLWKPNLIWSFVSSAAWILELAWTRLHPLTGVTLGDSVDNLFVTICIAAAIAMPVYTGFDMRKKNKANNSNGSIHKDSERERFSNGSGRRISEETTEEYSQRIYNKLHPRRRVE